jgi:CheY-like chemotaxis protein
MPINLKNYTTEVPAFRSIDNIERLLMQFGASHIMKEIENNQVMAISFRITVDKMPVAIKLPAKVKNIVAWLKRKKPQQTDKARNEQAVRIAWKQQYELLFLQLSMVEMDQMELLEALLPNAYDIKNNQTFYDKIKQQNFTPLLTES